MLDGTPLVIPIGHALPLYRTLHPDYSANIGLIAATLARRHPGMRLIDIGANVGDTVAIVFRQVRIPVLCIEGDPYYARLLRRNMRPLSDLVEIHEGLVGGVAGMAMVELRRNVGTAAIRPVSGSGPGVRMESLSAILSTHPAFAAPGLIKIDTDGLDMEILAGALDLAARAKPVLFFEYDPGAGHAQPGLFQSLLCAGYHGLLLYDNIGRLIRHSILDGDAAISVAAQYRALPPGGYLDLAVFHVDDDESFRELAI